MATSAGKHPGSKVDHDGVEHVVARLPFDIGQVVRVHSVLVWLLCLTTIVTAIRLRDRSPAALQVCTQLLIVVVAQGALGYVQYFSGVPALMVGFHVAGAIVVWVMALRVGFATAGTATSPAAAGTAPGTAPSSAGSLAS